MTCKNCKGCSCKNRKKTCEVCAHWSVHVGGDFGSCSQRVNWYREETTGKSFSCEKFFARSEVK